MTVNECCSIDRTVTILSRLCQNAIQNDETWLILPPYQRHCLSPKCPTMCRLGLYIAIWSYIVGYRSLIMCLRLHLRVTSYMSEFAPATVFFSVQLKRLYLMPVSCFDKHTCIMPRMYLYLQPCGVLSTTLWLVYHIMD